MLDVDEVTKTVVKTAEMICAEQPDMSAPTAITDLDSFSFVQVALELENIYEVKLIEDLDQFDGTTFGALAELIARRAKAQNETNQHDGA